MSTVVKLPCMDSKDVDCHGSVPADVQYEDYLTEEQLQYLADCAEDITERVTIIDIDVEMPIEQVREIMKEEWHYSQKQLDEEFPISLGWKEIPITLRANCCCQCGK